MDAVVLIGFVVIAVTQMFKMAVPTIKGWVTIIVALLVAVFIALFDQTIGVSDISIAQAFVAWFEAVGLSTLAGKAGGGSAGDTTTTSTIR
jgi:hypothetical protein